MNVVVQICPTRDGESVRDERAFNLGWENQKTDVLIAVFQQSTGDVGYVASFTQKELLADGEAIGRAIAASIK